MDGLVWARFFSEGFFGYGEKGNFRYWSLAHFAPLILFGVAIYLLFRYRERIRAWRYEENFRYGLGIAMIICEMSYYWRLTYVGPGCFGEYSLLDKLPLQICGWSCIFAAIMMFKKSRFFHSICFYICLTVGIFPLLTPAVISTTGPGYYRYYQYWLEHILPPLSVLYMTFVHGYLVKIRDMLKPACFLAVLAPLAILANFKLPELVAAAEPGYNPNYLYLAVGTSDGGGSLMDVLMKIAPNIWARILVLAAVVAILFFLAYYVQRGIIALYRRVTEKRNKK
jgi:hypothetical integral membrane protein (TIGR02206 family)